MVVVTPKNINIKKLKIIVFIKTYSFQYYNKRKK